MLIHTKIKFIKVIKFSDIIFATKDIHTISNTINERPLLFVASLSSFSCTQSFVPV